MKAPNLSPVNSLTYPSQDRTFTFSWSHMLSPSTLNEVRLGANKQDLPRNYAAYTPGGIGTLNGFITTPAIEFLQANGGSATLLDTFSHTIGRHSLKAGFEVRRYHYGRANFQNPIYQMDTVNDILDEQPVLRQRHAHGQPDDAPAHHRGWNLRAGRFPRQSRPHTEPGHALGILHAGERARRAALQRGRQPVRSLPPRRASRSGIRTTTISDRASAWPGICSAATKM